jgi:uncharacterized protein (DUF433 family)
MSALSDRITIRPDVCHGQACIRGTRVPVHQIVRMLANGDTVEGLLDDYPHVTREDIAARLDYAASLAEEQVGPINEVADQARTARSYSLSSVLRREG